MVLRCCVYFGLGALVMKVRWQVVEFENIMLRFDVHVYVVPYEYCYECYEDVYLIHEA